MSKAKCTVVFRHDATRKWDTAILMHRGRSLNVINYPRGTRMTKAKKARARRVLMAGCAELSRRRR